VGHIDDDTEPIAFFNDLCAEVRKPTGTSLAHAVAELVAHIVRETQASQPQPIEIAQIRYLLLERSTPLKANHQGDFPLPLGAANVIDRSGKNEVRRFFHLGMCMIQSTHEALQIRRRKSGCGQVPVGRISPDVIADCGYAPSAQRRQMPTIQYAAFSTFPSPVNIGGDDVAMTDEDDSLFVQIGRFVGH
jgi:hypothetical protein